MAEYQDVGGFLWPKFGFPPENFQVVRNLSLRPGDVVVNTYPKCGNTWMSYIVWEILHDGQPPPQPADMKNHIPFPDMNGTKGLDTLPSPRAMITHVPLPHFPFKPDVKYIVVFRNPFDTCVSFFHFSKRKIGENTFNITFDEFFEDFLKGLTAFGDFFDYFNAWNPHRNDPNVLFLTYEEMLADRVGCIKRVAKFMGEEYAQKLEKDPTMLENIVKYSSFDYMKQKLEFIIPTGQGAQKIDFFRKGIVGDWKNDFSESQTARLREKMESTMKGSETLDFWLKILQF